MKRYTLICGLLIGVLISCTEPIDWKVDKSEIKLVVEGGITSEMRQHTVILTQTADYFSNTLPTRVSNAQVTISDGTRTFELVESAQEKGKYFTEVMAGEVGKTYTLDIALEKEIGGEQNFTASSTLHKVVQIDSMRVRYGTVTDFDFVYDTYIISFSGQEIIGSKDYWTADLIVNSESRTTTAYETELRDDYLIEDEYLEDVDVWDGFVEAGDTLTLKFYSTEKEYDEFIRGLQAEYEGQDELGLSGPPANILGNISNGALGYFLASDVSSATIMVPEGLAPADE